MANPFKSKLIQQKNIFIHLIQGVSELTSQIKLAIIEDNNLSK